MTDDVTLLLRIVCVWWIARYCVNRLWRPIAFRRTTTIEPSEHLDSSATPVSPIRYFAAMILVASVTSLAAFNGEPHGSFLAFSAAMFFLQGIDCIVATSAGGRLRTWLSCLVILLVLMIAANYCDGYSSGSAVDRLLASMREIIRQRYTWIVGLGYFLAVFPAGDVIGRFMKRWSDLMTGEQGLPDAGKWIGRLERFLAISLILVEQPAGIAVLLTAKGALRFGEIQFDARAGSTTTSAEQRKLVEYILVGSLMSYTAALVVAWILVALRSAATI